MARDVADMPSGGIPEKRKQVVKQGLSEYFLFTIDGREDIQHQQPKRLISMKVAEVPLPDGNVRLFSEYPNKDLAYVDLHDVDGRVERVGRLVLVHDSQVQRIAIEPVDCQ